MRSHSRRTLALLGTVVIAACARPATSRPSPSAALPAPLPGRAVYDGDVS